MVSPPFQAYSSKLQDPQKIDLKKKSTPYFTICEVMLLIGGFCILISVFMTWVQYTSVVSTRPFLNSFRGIDFALRTQSPFPEAFFLPLLAIIIIASGFFSAGRRRSTHTVPFRKDEVNRPSTLALLCAIVSLVITFEIAYRFSLFMSSELSLNFWDNTRIGWYLALLSGFIALFGAAISFGKKMRSMGFLDYFLVRAPDAEHSQNSIPNPQLPYYMQGAP